LVQILNVDCTNIFTETLLHFLIKLEILLLFDLKFDENYKEGMRNQVTS